MWKEKLSSFLIDVAKYILTAVLVASLVKDFGEDKMLVYFLGSGGAIALLVGGLMLSNKEMK